MTFVLILLGHKMGLWFLFNGAIRMINHRRTCIEINLRCFDEYRLILESGDIGPFRSDCPRRGNRPDVTRRGAGPVYVGPR